MKCGLTFIGCWICCLGFAQTTIRSGHLTIAVNTKMQTSVATDLAVTPLVKGFSNSEYLETKYFTARDFALTSSAKRQLNGAIEYIYRGLNADHKVEKI